MCGVCVCVCVWCVRVCACVCGVCLCACACVRVCVCVCMHAYVHMYVLYVCLHSEALECSGLEYDSSLLFVCCLTVLEGLWTS